MYYPLKGNPICEAMKNMPITGNVIPKQWYQTLVTPKGHPNHLAIAVLGEVVFRYRPVEDHDGTGQVVDYKKSFRDDLLQISYTDLAALFNVSADSIKDAVLFLEGLGVICRELRTVRLMGRTLPNVLYLSLNVERLTELTFPPVPGDAVPHEEAFSPSVSVKTLPGHEGEISPHISGVSSPAYTKKETKTSLYTSEETKPTPWAGGAPLPSLPAEKISALSFSSKEELSHIIRQLTDYDLRMAPNYLVGANAAEKTQWQQVFDAVVTAMVDMCCFAGVKQLASGRRSAGDAISAFDRLLQSEEDDGLAALAETVTEAFIVETKNRNVRNPAAYLTAMLFAFAEDPERHGLPCDTAEDILLQQSIARDIRHRKAVG